ncbi:MAG: aldo/keto reductase, partial [Halomonas sp.]|nr:aldo/keto reductase [Halomonas sp.]
MPQHHQSTRRRLLRSIAAGLLSASAPLALPSTARADQAQIRRRLPSSGEAVAAIGMGTWITFNVGSDPRARAQRT